MCDDGLFILIIELTDNYAKEIFLSYHITDKIRTTIMENLNRRWIQSISGLPLTYGNYFYKLQDYLEEMISFWLTIFQLSHE